MKTTIKIAISMLLGAGAVFLWDHGMPQSLSDVGICDAPSGAMDAISYNEMFIGRLHDIKFGCIPNVRGICQSYLCREFTAIDADEKHVIGYVWRDVFNKPHATDCSPDGGKAGTFYGECPVGTPAPTVYRCPWCEPNLDAVADTRGKK